MADEDPPKGFPDVSLKLSAPAKPSLFQRQKAEAEAKKAREEAETAAVFKEFVESFEGDEDPGSAPASTMGHLGRSNDRATTRGNTGPPRRHFPETSSRSLNSGPGTLGPEPSAPSRKRTHDGLSRAFGREGDQGLFAFEDSPPPNRVDLAKDAFSRSGEEEDTSEAGSRAAERAAPKPTLQLTSVPPGTSAAVIKSLLPKSLSVDGVRILPPSGPGSAGSTDRKSITVIVTLAEDTPGSEMDNAVNVLQNRYLGWGFHLNISRHLSSAVLGSSTSRGSALHSSLVSLPFGAKAAIPNSGSSMSRAPPPDAGRGFAPPSDYTPLNQSHSRQPLAQVNIKPPSDIRQVRLIHKTVEAVIDNGPQFEALLMTRPEVQREEKWAWIWDPRSAGGVWYRWRLWEIMSGIQSSSSSNRRSVSTAPNLHQLFDNAPPWLEPQETFPFEFTTDFADVVSDTDYDSSEEEESDDEGGARNRRRQQFDPAQREDSGYVTDDPNEETYLNPLQRAKLIHLLSRLPTTTGKLRKGDVARVTSFCISHASCGAAEMVEMLVNNVKHPLSFSQYAKGSDRRIREDSDLSSDESAKGEDTTDQLSSDSSSATLIGLYLISDILSASSTSGVRHAWRFRTLLENALTQHHIFKWLGRLEKTLNWGRLRAEKWRRSIKNVLEQWESWSIFPSAAQQQFVEDFGSGDKEEQAESTDATKGFKSKESRWKTVTENDSMPGSDAAEDDTQQKGNEEAGADEADARIAEVIDSKEKDTGVDDFTADDTQKSPSSIVPLEHTKVAAGTTQPGGRKPRPKAVDMFADSDDDA